MRTCLETIRLEDGKLLHLSDHETRMNRTRRALWGCRSDLNLDEMISVPHGFQEGVYKCRVLYETALLQVTFEPYAIRPVRSIRLVEDDAFDYAHKWADRSRFAAHLQVAGTDDILIVQNGCLTDTSYANIAFWDGRRWLTPATPLLSGTCRRRLIQSGILSEERITPGDLRHFSHARLINAMLPWPPDPLKDAFQETVFYPNGETLLLGPANNG